MKALSNLAHQQADLPFEARKAFDSICVRDPEGRYTDVKLAVVKVKYQRVTINQWLRPDLLTLQKDTRDEESIEHLKDRVSEYEDKLDVARHESKHRIKVNLRHSKQRLNAATCPVQDSKSAMSNEIKALERLCNSDCPHTPHLIIAETQRLIPGLDAMR